MKRLGSAVLLSVLALIGCDNTSRLDKTTKAPPKAEAQAQAQAASTPAKVDRSGSVEERLARLEDNYAKYAEALDFLGKVYAQQKAQQQAQAREEPAPDAVFAVDIAANVKAGMLEGPAAAPVTIVEAWDFA